MILDKKLEELELGRGRSGTVYQSKDADGKNIAIKRFGEGSLLTKLIDYSALGAPNPYSWNEDTSQCVNYRREIISELVYYWFGSKLKVLKALEINWDWKHKTYNLHTEFIDGRNALLHHSFSEQKEQELSDLVNTIMKPLQSRLIESGIDGLVWQAGKGNPVASNHFLLEQNNAEGDTWVWTNLESGLPALFPLNILSLFTFYLPKSIKQKRPLFDDVDIYKLRDYVKKESISLTKKIGNKKYNELIKNIDLLEYHQKRWKSLKRADRGIIYQLKKEKITEKQAGWYRRHTYIWYGREMSRALLGSYYKLMGEVPFKIFNGASLTVLNYKEITAKVWKCASSQKYRAEIARNYFLGRINEWEQRKQLKSYEADSLRVQLKSGGISAYLADFGVHMALNPAVKIIEWGGIPALYLTGIIDEKTSGILLGVSLVCSGSVSRTSYTLGRLIQSYIKKKEKPWIALGWGIIPKVGSAAYPLQMLYSGKEYSDLAKFILYDAFAQIGQNIPIWGGKDTLVEHFFNHIPDLLIRNRQGIKY